MRCSNPCLLTEIAEGAAPEVEVEPEAVGAVGDLGGVRGALGHVFGAVVDRVGEGVGAVDGAVRRADGRLPHEALRACKERGELCQKGKSPFRFRSFALEMSAGKEGAAG